MDKRLKTLSQSIPLEMFWRHTSFFLMVCVPLVLVWSGVILARHPYSGMTWSFTSGRVNNVDPRGPAAGIVREGDHIRSIDGKPVYRAREFPGREPREKIAMMVERDGATREVTIELASSPIDVLLTRFSTLLVALFFWVPGLIVLIYGKPSALTKAFLLFCLSFSLVLSLGAVSGKGPLWVGWIFNIIVWWVGPFALHVHLLLGGHIDRGWWKLLIQYLYLAALGFSVLDLVRLSLEVPGSLLTIKYIWLSLLLILSAAVLVFAARVASDMEDRRRSRIAGLAAMNAFLPFIFLSLLPETLFGQYILPYEATFLALSVLPLGYSYAMMRYRLVPLEPYINRASAYTLLGLAIATLYGTIYVISPALLFDPGLFNRWFGFIIVLLLTLTAHPLYKLLRRWVDRLFYGGWYDDRGAAQTISQAIQSGGSDIYSIAQTLCKALRTTMQLRYATLLLNDGRMAVSPPLKVIGERGESDLSSKEVDHIFRVFSRQNPREIGKGGEARDLLASSNLSALDILGPEPIYWLLLEGKRGPQGLLVLGSRIGGGEFLPQDLEILEAVLQQAGAALENAVLLSEVKQRSEQIRKLHRKIIIVREEERKRVAHTLHDEIIQALVGLKYRLNDVGQLPEQDISHQFGQLREQIREILASLRRTIAGLRPPALDSLGLTSLIRSRVVELNAQVPFDIYLHIMDKQGVELADRIALTIYRCFQEAMANVQKHAEACRVYVKLQIVAEQRAVLSVKDDGVGFEVPEQLETLTEGQHFGLNGIREQVEMIGGELQVTSEQGEGTLVKVLIPLSRENADQGGISEPHRQEEEI